ncbi:MAG: AAA family ATPase [Firmicutes bacterium]|nr:AAA family ATPase [Bacillota bacterium]
MDYFAEIIGQDRALAPLRQALDSGKISHAYLLAGPVGVGKLSTAQELARAIILSSDPPGEAYWREAAHPDFMYIEKMEKKTLIGIEQINKDMEPWLALKPYRAARRVVIINEAHLLSLPAANALLKTLEEPPGHAVIILVADEQNLLETIVSRCQMIRFSPVGEASILDILLQRGVEPERASRLARLGQGSIAAAIRWTEEEGLEQLREEASALVQGLARGGEIEVFKCAEGIEKNPALLTGLLTATLRDIYIFQATGAQELLVLEENLALYQRFPRLDPGRVKSALEKINELSRQFRGPVSPLLLSINISYRLQDGLK